MSPKYKTAGPRVDRGTGSPAGRQSPPGPASGASDTGSGSAAAPRTRAFSCRNRTLAIDARALGQQYEQLDATALAPEEQAAQDSETAVVVVRGPLTHHSDLWCWFDSYDAIRDRVATALASPAKQVLLHLDSPGGEVSGCFETARALRAMATKAGKPLIAYADAQACSASYALACAAEKIVAVQEGTVGSVGVIAELWNEQDAAAQFGSKCELFTSGEAKADGHPMAEVTDGMRERVQAHVLEEAAIFWAWVAEARGLSVEAVQGLKAQHFHAEQAKALGLIDEIGGFDVALTMPVNAATTEAAASGGRTGATMAKMDDARKVLSELAADDSEEGRRARRALGALDDKEKEGDDEPKSESDGDEGEDEADDDAEDEAEDETPAEPEKKDDDAEDEEAKAKAEDEDAKRCDADAKKADDEARKSEDETDEALSRADSKAAVRARKSAKAAKARAANARNQARIHRSNAATHRSLAKVHGKFNTATTAKPATAPAKKPATSLSEKLATSNAAQAAHGNETQPKGGVKPPTAAVSDGRKPIDQVDPKILAAAGIRPPASNDPLVKYDGHGMSIGARLSDPQTARDYLAGKVGA